MKALYEDTPSSLRFVIKAVRGALCGAALEKALAELPVARRLLHREIWESSMAAATEGRFSSSVVLR